MRADYWLAALVGIANASAVLPRGDKYGAYDPKPQKYDAEEKYDAVYRRGGYDPYDAKPAKSDYTPKPKPKPKPTPKPKYKAEDSDEESYDPVYRRGGYDPEPSYDAYSTESSTSDSDCEEDDGYKPAPPPPPPTPHYKPKKPASNSYDPVYRRGYGGASHDLPNPYAADSTSSDSSDCESESSDDEYPAAPSYGADDYEEEDYDVYRRMNMGDYKPKPKPTPKPTPKPKYDAEESYDPVYRRGNKYGSYPESDSDSSDCESSSSDDEYPSAPSYGADDYDVYRRMNMGDYKPKPKPTPKPAPKPKYDAEESYDPVYRRGNKYGSYPESDSDSSDCESSSSDDEYPAAPSYGADDYEEDDYDVYRRMNMGDYKPKPKPTPKPAPKPKYEAEDSDEKSYDPVYRRGSYDPKPAPKSYDAAPSYDSDSDSCSSSDSESEYETSPSYDTDSSYGSYRKHKRAEMAAAMAAGSPPKKDYHPTPTGYAPAKPAKPTSYAADPEECSSSSSDSYPSKDPSDSYPSKDQSDSYPSKDQSDSYPSKDQSDSYPSNDYESNSYPWNDDESSSYPWDTEDSEDEYPSSGYQAQSSYYKRQQRPKSHSHPSPPSSLASWRPKTQHPEFFSLRIDATCTDPAAADPDPGCTFLNMAIRLENGILIATPYNKWFDPVLPIFFIDDDTQMYTVSRIPLQIYVNTITGAVQYSNVGQTPNNAITWSFYKNGNNPLGVVNPSPSHVSWPSTQGVAEGSLEEEPFELCALGGTGQYQLFVSSLNAGNNNPGSGITPDAASCQPVSLASINANPYQKGAQLPWQAVTVGTAK